MHSSLRMTQQFFVTRYTPRKFFLCLFIINYDFDADSVADSDEYHPNEHFGSVGNNKMHSSLRMTQLFFVTRYPPRKFFLCLLIINYDFDADSVADFDENHPHAHLGSVGHTFHNMHSSLCMTQLFFVTRYPPRKIFLCLFIINYDFDADSVADFDENHPHAHLGSVGHTLHKMHSSLHMTQLFFVTRYPPRKIFLCLFIINYDFDADSVADFDKNHPHAHLGSVGHTLHKMHCSLHKTQLFFLTAYPHEKLFFVCLL